MSAAKNTPGPWKISRNRRDNMIRMPPYLDNCTSVFPRTTRCDGQAIYHYPAPITRRFFMAVIRWGWAIVPVLLLAFVLTGCDDIDMHIAVQADLADAIATAAKEAGGQR